MKIIVIPDIHGRDIWKQIVEKEKNADKIVFLGDYLDSFDITPYKQIENLKEILEYKRENTDKVTLLMGNHDYHYMPQPIAWGVRYSGFNGILVPEVTPVFNDAFQKKDIQVCYVHNNIIFVHAGLSKTWCDIYNIDLDNLQESVNDLIYERIAAFDFLHSPNSFDYGDPYGDNIWQSPLWIRPHSLIIDRLDDYTQVVGHTQVSEIDLSMPIKPIDIFGSKDQYVIYENNKFKIREL